MNRTFFLTTTSLISFNLICSVLANLFPSGYWAILACVSYILFCGAMLRFRPASFLMLAPLLFLRATEMISGIAIEFGAYIEELSLQGYATGAFTRLAALYMFLFSVSTIVTERAWKKCRSHVLTFPERIPLTAGYWGLLIVVFFCLAFLVNLGWKSGFPLIEGIDRFRFRLDADSRIFVTISDNRFILTTVLGFFALDPARRRMSIFAISCIFFVSILYSEKFTSLSLMSIFMLMPWGFVYLARNENLPATLLVKIPAGIAILTLPIIFMVYGFFDNPDLALKKFGNRMAAQGELWWVADRDHMEFFRIESAPIIADIKTWLNPAAQNSVEVGTQFGLYYAMRPYAPGEIAYAAGNQGTGYVFSLFLYLMMTAGLAGMLVVGILAHFLFAAAMGWALRAISDCDWLRLLITLKLINFVVSGGFIVGYLWSFFGIKTIVLILLILFFQTVRTPFFATAWPKKNAHI